MVTHDWSEKTADCDSTRLSAFGQADDRAKRTGEDCRVYHVARDQQGRNCVWYVRSVSEGAPEGEPNADLEYYAHD